MTAESPTPKPIAPKEKPDAPNVPDSEREEGLKRQESALQSIRAVYGLLPQISGVAVGVTSLAFIAGWQYAQTYYSAMGAKWIVSLLTATQFLLKYATPILIIAIIAISSTSGVFNKRERDTQKKLRLSDYVLLASILLLVIIQMLRSHLPLSILQVATAILLALLSGSLGWKIGELTESLRDDNLEWRGRHIIMIYTIVMFGFVQGPWIAASQQAYIDSNPTFSDLPYVETQQLKQSDGWRLVEAWQGQLLIMKPATEPAKPEFKLIAWSDVLTIKPAKHP